MPEPTSISNHKTGEACGESNAKEVADPIENSDKVNDAHQGSSSKESGRDSMSREDFSRNNLSSCTISVASFTPDSIATEQDKEKNIRGYSDILEALEKLERTDGVKELAKSEARPPTRTSKSADKIRSS